MITSFKTIFFLDKWSVGEKGFCVDWQSFDQNTGTKTLPNQETALDCKDLCRQRSDATACEYSSQRGGCMYHTTGIKGGNGNSDYTCWINRHSMIKTKRLY